MNFDELKTEGHGAACTACSLPIYETAYRVRGTVGVHCDIACLETSLFGTERCRWCGMKLEKAYTTVESRLCSEGCSDSYWKQVIGDRTAALGKGKRFVLWLQNNQPDIYAKLVGAMDEKSERKLGRPRKNAHTMGRACERISQ